jgi:DNA-binding PadR family transcriptional regulator
LIVARGTLGEFEHLILLAVFRLGDEAYGVPVIHEVEERTGRTVTQAAAYLTLRRLEDKGLIKSTLGKPTAERGGRAKRYFEITPAGAALLRDSRAALDKMWEGISPELDWV